MDTQTFSQVVETIPVGPVLWVVLGITFIVFGVYSVILLWHWNEYSTGKFTTITNMVTYGTVGVGLLALMVLSATWYSLS